LKLRIVSGFEIDSLYLKETVIHPHELCDVGLRIEVFSDLDLSKVPSQNIVMNVTFHFL